MNSIQCDIQILNLEKREPCYRIRKFIGRYPEMKYQDGKRLVHASLSTTLFYISWFAFYFFTKTHFSCATLNLNMLISGLNKSLLHKSHNSNLIRLDVTTFTQLVNPRMSELSSVP